MVTSALAPDVLANTCATTGQHASMPIRPDLAVERGIVTLTSGFVNFLEPARLGDVLVLEAHEVTVRGRSASTTSRFDRARP